MLKAIRSLNYGFMPLYPAPYITTPIKWFGSLIGPVIHVNAIGLNKYISISIFLWGMWGDRVLSLMQRGFTAPHRCFFIGEIPHKKWGGEKAPNQTNKTVPHKICGELPTTANATSLDSRGFGGYLPNSPRFITTHTYILLVPQHRACGSLRQRAPVRVIRTPLFLSFCVSIGLDYRFQIKA